jgi:hypothetical protein
MPWTAASQQCLQPATVVAVCKDRDAKVELNHRNQACEVLADTGFASREIDEVLAHGQKG